MDYQLFDRVIDDLDVIRRELGNSSNHDGARNIASTHALLNHMRQEIADLNKQLQQAVHYEQKAFDKDTDVNGGDLVNWFSDWRNDAKLILAKHKS